MYCKLGQTHMKVAFLTNIISSHQVELWDQFISHDEVYFKYVYTKKENDETRYKTTKRDYCVYSKDISAIEQFLDEYDILIVSLGSIEDERINKYLSGKNNLFIYSEHVSKKIDISKKCKKIKYYLYHLLHRGKYYKSISRKNIVLCSSSHAGYDFHSSGFPKKNIFKFGYFPKYEFIDGELKSFKNIVFSGRNIEWKHPEDSIFALEYLKNEGENFSLLIAGKGFENYQFNNNDSVSVLGELDHDKLITVLQNSDLYIFPSTREEGWGVALPEAMASGCFIIANSAAGSTNYLIKNGFNGFTYRNRKQLIKRLNQYLALSSRKKNIIRKSC